MTHSNSALHSGDFNSCHLQTVDNSHVMGNYAPKLLVDFQVFLFFKPVETFTCCFYPYTAAILLPVIAEKYPIARIISIKAKSIQKKIPKA
jgi:hypothetical protein